MRRTSDDICSNCLGLSSVHPFGAIAKIGQPRHDHPRINGNPTLPPKTIEEPARQLPLYGEYEVAVLGGGPAGIAAAVASARATADAFDRALWVSRRHGHGGGGDELLRAACQRFWRDASRGAGHRIRAARAHRSARWAQRVASDLWENPGAGL